MVESIPAADSQLDALREAGGVWPAAAPAPEPTGADLTIRSVRAGSYPGDTYVRVERAGRGAFRAAGPETLRATAAVPRAHSPLGSLVIAAKRRVVGDPLANERAGHERLTKVKALAVLSSDAISSVAYATGQMLAVLLAAGTASFNVSLSIGAVIALLFAMVVLSYRQTIKAYPKGGGSYIVASDNLGPLAGLIAGSSLMIDYVLTVAVSVVSGVAALTSMAPGLTPFTLVLDLAFLLLLLFGNLRGIRESGTIFMLPSYAFIAGVYLMLIAGSIRFLTGGMHVAPPPHVVAATETLSAFLMLRAFAGGCTALTGVEAISDGVPAFQPPEWQNARTTLTTLGLIAISMFLGITLLVHAFGLVPNPGDNVPTLISKLNHATLGSGVLFFYVQITTALILLLAANTAFSDFPRLAFFMARDGFLPHQFVHKGDRLSYSNGILVLAALATLLVIRYWQDTSALFNLYVIGVFASFTLSQSGMVRRWWTRREEGWRKGMLLNGGGATLTAIVLGITASTKFLAGAWIVVVLVPVLVIMFFRIRAHYRWSALALRPRRATPPDHLRHRILAPVGAEEQGLLTAAFAHSLHADQVCAVAATRSPGASPSGEEAPLLPARGYARALRLEATRLASAADAPVTVILPPRSRGWLDRPRRRLARQTLLRLPGAAVAEIAPGTTPAALSAEGRTTLVLVASLDQAGLNALAYAYSLLGGRVRAVRVAAAEDREVARHAWDAWGNHVPLVIIDSPYRAIVPPLLAYVDALVQQRPHEAVTVVLPLVLSRGLLGRLLHNHTANRLRRALLRRPNIVVISVPWRLP